MTQYYLKASLNPSFTIDSDAIIQKLNEELKDFLKGVINTVGEMGVKYDLAPVFGQKYEKFWY